MAQKNLLVKGAREHNLKNIDIEIPRDKLVVFTGLSGSGKSSLAFDTIYAEGQRRYVESLSSYARQFLGQMEKPDVDSIDGLSPAISIDQKTTSKYPRSTVGTVTEIHDYLRLLYARVGIPHCPVCGKEIKQQTVDQIVDRIMALDEGAKIQVLAPVIRGRKGEHSKELDAARKSGYVRVRVDGSIYDLSETIKLDKNKKHNIEVVIDRLVIDEEIRARLADSVETACALSGGILLIDVVGGEELLFSQNYACPEHGVSIEELTPRMFSFNNPFGACQTCSGLGIFMKVDPKLVIPNPRLSIRQGAIKASGWTAAEGGTIAQMYFEALAEHYHFSLDEPVNKLSKEALDAVLYGTKGKKIKMHRRSEYGSGTYTTDFEGVIPNLERRYQETSSEWSRAEIEQVMSAKPCPDCGGARLRPESLSVTVGGINIDQFSHKSITDALEFVNALRLTTREQMMDELAATLGGRVSEQLTFGEISTGALNDLERVTKQAYAMVAYYGMSENVGTLSFYDSTGQSDMAFTKPYSELTAQQIDAEAKQVIEKAYKMAEKVLREHADGLKELAELLLSREVVFTEDVERIFGRRKKDIERERREAEAKARAEGGKPAGEEPQAGKQAAAVADPSAKSDKSETAEPAPVAPAVAAPETE